ncbi:MerR family transcriptional regulator [Streptomyces acidiscabies]|uniref:MerR family transcriptional regulator n=1 Tax=Streptomyces acidiscabies TaxID=42234 RepID=A0AAP6BIV6_9ACTN|nr:MerR family transcriptional regulator [Streptomyces acidiscabies]MBP5942279.1 MerR family transcriptional regulator [Streptomyces sp. LBUM 1476]MBZ3913812.1 MerR family transcriptional regulator [Streptomyces acidiscabies]MDX2965287.1 MerR family transcriptional regulator [Streptomyces acidiscabies]MDX3022097.1 MerR family transcriptional regulator [Streptomyces acidiscabies]MDX3793661.1 MerR family transcriptional regulator [Streptomyces acidiscabies]
MRSIGEMARDSGLGASALRFYDRAGVLVPAWVDPVSGYRWYEPEQLEEARVLTRLRRAGMPLADIRLVLASWSGADTDLVRKLLTAHLRRIEQGLSDARSEFSALQALLDHRENVMTSLSVATVRLSVAAPELAAALDTVRFAASADPELPMLGGVLFDIEGESLHVVATDRYRMAVAQAGVAGHGGSRVQVIVPAPLVDAMRALSDGEGSVRLCVDGGRVTLEAGDRQAAGQCLDHDFPDYRRLLPAAGGRRALVEVTAFRKALETGPVRAAEGGAPELSVLRVEDGGTVTLCADGDDDPNRVAVNREFLLDALAAGARDRLFLELGAPTTPIAIRRPDGEDGFSILMPVRMED